MSGLRTTSLQEYFQVWNHHAGQSGAITPQPTAITRKNPHRATGSQQQKRQD